MHRFNKQPARKKVTNNLWELTGRLVAEELLMVRNRFPQAAGLAQC